MCNKKQTSVLVTILFTFSIPLSLAAQQYDNSHSNEDTISVSDPELLVNSNDVRLQETTRTFRKAKFEGLRKRYKSIDGIVMVGITNDKGEVLLRGPQNWAPLGGQVNLGEDWAAAARRTIKEQTGAEITIDAPVLVECMHFYQKTNKDAHFTAFILHFRASFAEKKVDFTENPDGENTATFMWFEKVPENAHPNHVNHIQLYLE